jgi:hypothetical protein
VFPAVAEIFAQPGRPPVRHGHTEDGMDVWIVPAPACGLTRPRASLIRELAEADPASACFLCLICFSISSIV